MTYPQDLNTVEGEIKLAGADLKRAEDRVDWARRMFDKGYVTQAQTTSEELNLQADKYVLEQAESKQHVLRDYTRDKTLKELRSEVEKARSDELAREAIWNLEKLKESRLARELSIEEEEISRRGDWLKPRWQRFDREFGKSKAAPGSRPEERISRDQYAVNCGLFSFSVPAFAGLL